MLKIPRDLQRLFKHYAIDVRQNANLFCDRQKRIRCDKPTFWVLPPDEDLGAGNLVAACMHLGLEEWHELLFGQADVDFVRDLAVFLNPTVQLGRIQLQASTAQFLRFVQGRIRMLQQLGNRVLARPDDGTAKARSVSADLSFVDQVFADPGL